MFFPPILNMVTLKRIQQWNLSDGIVFNSCKVTRENFWLNLTNSYWHYNSVFDNFFFLFFFSHMVAIDGGVNVVSLVSPRCLWNGGKTSVKLVNMLLILSKHWSSELMFTYSMSSYFTCATFPSVSKGPEYDLSPQVRKVACERSLCNTRACIFIVTQVWAIILIDISGLEIRGSPRVCCSQILGRTPRFWLARSPSDSQN